MMRTCNNYELRGTRSYTKVIGRFNPAHAGRSQSARSKHVVFFFMCRSTCSHCWKQALSLARLAGELEVHNTSVMLVGDGRYKGPAQRLVKVLNLPFRYVADNGALRRYYHVDINKDQHCSWAIVLVDRQGAIRFRRLGCPSVNVSPLNKLMSAVRIADTENPEHIMRNKPFIDCRKSVELVPQ
jgi:peroxiredoxin